ncbi:hypothetical protein QQF64_036114 [Cirrhinus molitorella]
MNYSESEIIQAILRIVKPGQFKEMLINKDNLTVPELKSFLQSHLSGRGSNFLSRCPLDINQYITECTEELSSEIVKTTWEGAEQKDVAWVAALNQAQEGQLENDAGEVLRKS